MEVLEVNLQFAVGLLGDVRGAKVGKAVAKAGRFGRIHAFVLLEGALHRESGAAIVSVLARNRSKHLRAPT